MSGTSTTTPTVRPKEFHFPLSVHWTRERRVTAQVKGKPEIEITPPPVFRGTDPTTWSPEDFFVAAAASFSPSPSPVSRHAQVSRTRA